MEIDLNADLGEGAGSDEALLGLVSSANIACGWHAGDAKTMRQCVQWALEHGVAIGAHPSFPDRENFGRSTMHLPPDEITAGVLYQVGALAAIVKAEGGTLAHVKPHGQLYNQAVKEPELAMAIVDAVRRFDPSLKFFGLAGSGMIEAARRALTRHMKRAGRVWIRVFPDVPVSKKPIEVRMGKGKGTPELWVTRVKPGRIIFEIDGIPPALAREALALAAAKLPIKTRFVERIAE